jgi:hypothetical protein
MEEQFVEMCGTGILRRTTTGIITEVKDIKK